MKRVLVVDDDPDILLVMSRIVSSCGWDALLAHSGREALALVESASVVVTDLSMPGMDGFELLRAIRRRDDTLPVILVTGRYTEPLAECAMAAGAFQCLPKPFHLHVLTLAISKAMKVPRRLRPEPPISSVG